MHFDQNYLNLTRDVYRVDPKHEKYDPDIIKDTIIQYNDFDYEVLKIDNNTINGMQAMAVAPVINEKADTSEIVIAYAGTNPNDPLDVMTDLQTIGLGNKILIPKTQQLDLDKYYELDERGVSKSIEYVDGQIYLVKQGQ